LCGLSNIISSCAVKRRNVSSWLWWWSILFVVACYWCCCFFCRPLTDAVILLRLNAFLIICKFLRCVSSLSSSPLMKVFSSLLAHVAIVFYAATTVVSPAIYCCTRSVDDDGCFLFPSSLSSLLSLSLAKKTESRD